MTTTESLALAGSGPASEDFVEHGGFVLSRAVWGVPFDRFVGPGAVSEAFAVDGRDGDHPHFDADPSGDALWTSDDGAYSVREIADPDWEPADTVLLLAGDEVVGFYAEGMAWIDPGHRGKGLSTPLILGGCTVAGGPPFDNVESMGFSFAGWKAHAAAWREAVRIAADLGADVPDDVLDEAGVGRGPKPAA